MQQDSRKYKVIPDPCHRDHHDICHKFMGKMGCDSLAHGGKYRSGARTWATL